MLTEPDDRAHAVLATFYVERSEEAFCALFRLMFPKLKRYLSLYGGAADVAEQLAIDSLYTVWQRIADVREPATLAGWIYRVARNQLLQHHRRTRAEAQVLAAYAARDESSAAVACGDMATAALELRDWLSCLDPQGREIMLLRFVEGLEYHEIAEAVSMPLGTVKWKVSDCKLKLARSLGLREKV